MFNKNKAVFMYTAMLAFIFNLMPLSVHSLSGRQTSARAGSVRPDGTLDFLHADGSKIVSIVIEIAETDEAQTKGLMGRRSLNLTEGMLFIYEREDLRHFWMKNTPVSLDMIFADQEGRIVHMAESTLPMTQQTYSSQFPARYVVEVPAGFAKFFKIKKGMRIQWRRH